MKEIIVKSGKPILEEVAVPKVDKNSVLIQVVYSCISQGTELSGMKIDTDSSLSERFSDSIDKVKKVAEFYKNQGFNKTINKIHNYTKGLDKPSKKIGYSASGIVKDVGDNISDIQIGDRVSCAGAGFANHADFVIVPRNLVMKVPKNLNLKLASTATLGGIAMQGVRRGNFHIGEFVAVIGLGFLGQLTVQMLDASGCRVIAIDIQNERCNIAKTNGAEFVFNSKEDLNYTEKIKLISDGFGVDGVIFTAATDDPSVISHAFEMCKRKGKVILVGVAGNTINRNDLYPKELDYLISTSYGPGRYDDEYEIKGNDYPYAYVRWTENRNMEEYLRLLELKKIVIEDLIQKVYPISEAEKAYEELQIATKKPIVALFEYSEEPEANASFTKIEFNTIDEADHSKVNVAIIGAGNFARGMHLPNLEKMKDKYRIYAICDIDPLIAKSTAMKFKANLATTDFNDILQDDNIDLIMICTRHNLHAKYAIKGLKAGKAVFVEKPMAIEKNELEELISTIKEKQLPYMVGFNRRFSPCAQKIKEFITDRVNPVMISYQMNAGYLPLDHWVHEDGGRIIGEACHIIDLFNYFTGSEILSISYDKINPNTKAISPEDNIVLTIKYSDGSLANLIYTALGAKSYPKEQLVLYCDGNVYCMKDYLTLNVFSKADSKTIFELKKPDKGHFKELESLYETLIGKNQNLPIDLEDMIQTTQATLTL